MITNLETTVVAETMGLNSHSNHHGLAVSVLLRQAQGVVSLRR